MCDLFGLCCNKRDRATLSLPLFAERSNRNRDGWGIAYYENNRAIIKKKPEAAIESNEFYESIKNARSNNILSHVRWATHGTNCEENCHPFKIHYKNRDWTFAHNGVVRSVPRHNESEGNTDSEHVFRYIIDYIQEYLSEGHIRGLYPALINALQRIFADYGNDNNLNFLMSDGSMYYVFAHHDSKAMYLQQREKEYGGAVLISTRRLIRTENWKRIYPNRLLAINRGEIVSLSDPII